MGRREDCVCVCVYVDVYVCTYVCARMHVCACVCACVCVSRLAICGPIQCDSQFVDEVTVKRQSNNSQNRLQYVSEVTKMQLQKVYKYSQEFT